MLHCESDRCPLRRVSVATRYGIYTGWLSHSTGTRTPGGGGGVRVRGRGGGCAREKESWSGWFLRCFSTLASNTTHATSRAAIVLSSVTVRIVDVVHGDAAGGAAGARSPVLSCGTVRRASPAGGRASHAGGRAYHAGGRAYHAGGRSSSSSSGAGLGPGPVPGETGASSPHCCENGGATREPAAHRGGNWGWDGGCAELNGPAPQFP